MEPLARPDTPNLAGGEEDTAAALGRDEKTRARVWMDQWMSEDFRINEPESEHLKKKLSKSTL